MAVKAEQSPTEPIEAGLDTRFRGPLMKFFLRRVRSKAEAEDLTQDVFLKLLGAAHRQPIQDVEALVFVTAGNLLKDRSRKAQRRATELTEPPSDVAVSPSSGEFMEDRNPERVLLGRESVAEMLKALDELGERTRDIYVLFRLENMKQKEIAALFDVGRSTVEKEVMKAALHLALKFGPEGK